MSQTLSVAARLSPTVRQDIDVQVLLRSQPISYLAAQHQVSRKFVYQQGNNAQRSPDKPFVLRQISHRGTASSYPVRSAAANHRLFLR